MTGGYIHGYTPREQERLIQQAAFWRDLILADLRPGERLVELGCGAGAVLGVIASALPGSYAGADIEPAQIERAWEHLAALGASADLRVADARSTPWPDNSFDTVFIMWVLEHLRDPTPILREAHRLLRPGGRAVLTETDYTLVTHPESPDLVALMDAWHRLFDLRGNRLVSRALAPALRRAGFGRSASRLWPLHAWSEPGSDRLREIVNYIADFIEPECPVMARECGVPEVTLRAGVRHLRTLHERDDGALAGWVYRAVGVK